MTVSCPHPIRAGLFALVFACAITGCVPSSGQQGSDLHFQRHEVVDNQGFGYPVFQILIPENWQFSGQVQWQISMGLPQGFLTYQASSPDGTALVQRFPEQIYHWSDNPTLLNGYRMNGAATAPPVSASEFVRQMVLPAMDITGAQVTNVTPMPQLAAQSRDFQEMLLTQVYHPICPLQFSPQMEAEAALVDTVAENRSRQFLVVINRVYSATPTMYGPVRAVTWTAELTLFQAPRSRDTTLDAAFQVMIRSARISPRWAVDSTRLVATCARNMLQNQQQIFNQMRQIGQTQSEISDMIMDGWEKRNVIMDGVHDRFSDYIRGTEPYHDPIQNLDVDIPNMYENAWTNGLDYVFSDNPSFDPNRTADTRNWTRMNRVNR